MVPNGLHFSMNHLHGILTQGDLLLHSQVASQPTKPWKFDDLMILWVSVPKTGDTIGYLSKIIKKHRENLGRLSHTIRHTHPGPFSNPPSGENSGKSAPSLPAHSPRWSWSGAGWRGPMTNSWDTKVIFLWEMHHNMIIYSCIVEKFCSKTPNKNHPAIFFKTTFGRHARLMQQSQSTAPFFQQPCQFASPILKKLGENTPHMYSKPTIQIATFETPKKVNSLISRIPKFTQQKYGVDCWLRQVVCPSVWFYGSLAKFMSSSFWAKAASSAACL